MKIFPLYARKLCATSRIDTEYGIDPLTDRFNDGDTSDIPLNGTCSTSAPRRKSYTPSMSSVSTITCYKRGKKHA